jgi:hypothetical protein
VAFFEREEPSEVERALTRQPNDRRGSTLNASEFPELVNALVELLLTDRAAFDQQRVFAEVGWVQIWRDSRKMERTSGPKNRHCAE